jgi:hypothetical protein
MNIIKPELLAVLDKLHKHHMQRVEVGDVNAPDDGLIVPFPVVVMVTERGVARVLQGAPRMTFLVEAFTRSGGLPEPGRLNYYVAHVRDYRYVSPGRAWQIWSLGPDDYEVVSEVPTLYIEDSRIRAMRRLEM